MLKKGETIVEPPKPSLKHIIDQTPGLEVVNKVITELMTSDLSYGLKMAKLEKLIKPYAMKYNEDSYKKILSFAYKKSDERKDDSIE